MKKAKTILFRTLMLLFLVGTFASCTENVPVGYVGMITTTNGLQDEVYNPGNVTCFGRDKLYLLETSEEKHSTKMDILCKDDLNFKFTVNTRTKLEYQNKADVKDILQNKGGSATVVDGNSSIKRLDYDVIYNTYVSSVVDAVSRSVVSKYETTQIRENRDAIQTAIYKGIKEKLKGTPVKIISAELTNFDYPDVITKALEQAKERQIQRDQEKHVQELKLMRLDNERIATIKQKEVNRLKGQAEAVYIQEIQRVLNKNYLTLKEIEANEALYKRVKAGDKVIVKGDVQPLVSTH
jgi:hypothetical protein